MKYAGFGFIIVPGRSLKKTFGSISSKTQCYEENIQEVVPV